MDEKPPQQPAPIVVPYKPGAILVTGSKTVESEDIEKTKFQKIGDQYGTYGDSYGSLNTLFSGLAFAILIISLFMQRQELQAQRQELEAQRNEIKESNAIADKQREITEQQAKLNAQQIHDARVQNFYTLLFKFLDEKRKKIEDLEFSKKSDITGNYVFARFVDYVLNRIKSSYLYPEDLTGANINELDALIDELINNGHEYTNYLFIDFDYIEYICFILRFIEEHKNLGIVDTAINIFISQQTINEMTVISIISLRNKELKNFIIKWKLLRKMNTYEPDEHFQALIDRTIGEEAYKLVF